MRRAVSSMAGANVGASLRLVTDKIKVAAECRPQALQTANVRLVAVGKTKPIELIQQAYNHGQRNFGENYVQELSEKAANPDVVAKCPDIKWHFIGHLQRNKVKQLSSIANLYMVETVSSEKIASALDMSWGRLKRDDRLKVMAQINTSGEDTKHGATPDQSVKLVRHILEKCPNLHFIGLMTIGSFNHDLSSGPNPDFLILVDCKQHVCKELQLNLEAVELSMGMSNDFEHAIHLGSTNVRVGSTIFGARVYPAMKSGENRNATLPTSEPQSTVTT
ncbi:PREDICTED: proline synthase co-transcribed bacterial homolog protein-like [Priapulus caudatus]|uniref:Pyridoxal phosphate homeostasis protein n=1 Tax=Priapulus caudatus TaxID=37621 RepID=A0ABM1EDD2_PRICU|nr:PREDICTED: proline synthase co-transcribed bacterial homolog protein-like [Priapulus caudatus]